MNALGEKYGFKSLFFLPPHISLGNKPLTAEETEIKGEEEEGDPASRELFTTVYHRLESESLKHPEIYSMADIFDDSDALMWIDGGHATPVGNQLIARRILDIIEARS